MRRALAPFATAVLVALALAVARGQAGFTLKINKEAGVDVFMGMNRTKPLGKTASDGSIGLSPDDLNDSANKPRMAIARQQCDRDTTLHIVHADSEDEKKCRRQKSEKGQSGCGCDVLGYFPWGENKTIGRNLGRELIYLGGGIAGTGVILGTKGGGGTPAGNPPSGGGNPTPGGGTTTPPTTPPNSPVPIMVTITVQRDEGQEEAQVKFTTVTQVSKVTLQGNAVRFEGNTPWVPLEGTITNGVISARGTGIVAGFAGVLVTFDGVITASNQITQGTLTVGGPGGTQLPRGSITYRIVSR
jgi:hypothetical protein